MDVSAFRRRGRPKLPDNRKLRPATLALSPEMSARFRAYCRENGLSLGAGAEELFSIAFEVLRDRTRTRGRRPNGGPAPAPGLDSSF